MFEKKKILITVKAYPNPSKKYVETVCTAGIDLGENKWIRLYPVPFRDLEISKKFKKYDIIEAEVEKSTKDPRPESYKINCDSISRIAPLDTKQEWAQRKKLIMPLVGKSMCDIERLCDEKNVSLGMFKPRRDVEFLWEPVTSEFKPGTEELYAQLSLFNPQKKVLEKIPYIFRYKYFCENEPGCKGHKQCIIDWEIGESFRSWKKNIYKTDELTLEKIRNKWQNELFSEKRDSYLLVGNQHRFKTFMILGVFWPPKGK